MKSIRHKILFYILIPFLVIYSLLSVFIVYQIYKLKIRETEWELHSQAKHSASNLMKCFDIMELSVKISARELEKIDPDDPAARMRGENIITSRFYNPVVINAWLAFESNTFDGNDSLHTEDYSGAPSGRYIRSFYRDGDSWFTLDDMDENELYDPEEAFYYVIPMMTGAFYTDLGVSELLWDYGFGPVYVFGVNEPVFRGGKPIGVVGLDAVINEETLGSTGSADMVSAIFKQDGLLCYFRDTGEIGQNLEELGLDSNTGVLEYFANSHYETGFNFTGYSELTGANSFNHFYPLEIYGNTLYIYTAIPQKIILQQIIPVFLPIGVSFAVCLIVFVLLFSYFSNSIAAPLKKLAEASEIIGSGNLQMKIDVISSKDEMGMISRSLVRMAEQFRTNQILLNRYFDRFDLLLRIHYALFRSSALNEAFDKLLSEISKYHNVFCASFIFIIENEPRIVAIYPLTEREEGDSEFFAHNQVAKLLEGKKHLTMNGEVLEKAQLPFINFKTKAVCILPLRADEVLRGYVIMEGQNPGPIIHDDTTLLFTGDVLSYLISRRADWEREMQKTAENAGKINPAAIQEDEQELYMTEYDDTFLENAGNIQNLDVEKGLLLIGGDRKRYTELLKVTVKVVSESIAKLRSLYNKDLAAFAIEVHGIKAALYSIGADALGDEARQLEFAAKSDDDAYCRNSYPPFEEKLRVFSRNLAAIFPQQEKKSRKGEVTELEKVLEQVKKACDTFDVTAASSLLMPMVSLNWDNEVIQDALQNILVDIENLEYEGMTAKIQELFELVRK